ncbi:UPF0146 family protein [Thermococcus sp. 9N3]|uniref:UPF0146 family protein n=1 Tax=Thermococcus sp. 9N3 TaxID=163002 RepID=UPI00143091E2|nr:UPF0146 family protein [Thermococcus sp. 9N3]NJE49453.1 UPF0146 family protein [Thermococcus sp. 9N3]
MLEKLAEFIAQNFPRGKAVELGIGFQTKVALRLTELGYDVLAIDWNEKAVENARKAGIKALRDDLFRPMLGLYRDAVVLYSVRPTPEIMKPIVELSKNTGVPLVVLPLSGDSVPRPMRLVNYGGLAIYVYKP